MPPQFFDDLLSLLLDIHAQQAGFAFHKESKANNGSISLALHGMGLP